MTTIKTLAEILADMGEPVSADSPDGNNHKPSTKIKKTQSTQSDNPTARKSTQNPWQDFHELTLSEPKKTRLSDNDAINEPDLPTPSNTSKKHKSRNKPKAVPQPNMTHVLADNNQTILDEGTIQALQKVDIEPVYQNDKTVNRLRWLAFYYLSNRELSQKQLRQKLLDKDCDPDMVSDLLDEFADKGYQSDERCAHMLIRESVRRGRGKRHINQSLKKAGIDLPYSLDELIDQAGADSISDGTILDDETSAQSEINWLKLAIEARCKKYGNTTPKDPKEKARQLRFLQYRGFEMGVCFDALKYTLDHLDELI